MTTFLRDLPDWFLKYWELFTPFDHISASRDNPVQTALLGFSCFSPASGQSLPPPDFIGLGFQTGTVNNGE